MRIRGVSDASIGRVEGGGDALLEVAEAQHAGAQLFLSARLAQGTATHLLGSLLLAESFHFAPVHFAVPLAIVPMLHLINAFCLHAISPCLEVRGRPGFWRQSGSHVGLL